MWERHLDAAGINSELNGISCSTRSHVVHPSLEPLGPGIEMEGCEFSKVRLVHVYVEALALVNECSSISSHVHNSPLLDLPHSPVNGLQVIRNAINLLDGTIVVDHLVLQFLSPHSHACQVIEQVLIDHHKLATAKTAPIVQNCFKWGVSQRRNFKWI